MRPAIACLALGVLLPQPQPPYSPVQDGYPHGDPPYLIERGWQPLLNGKDLRQLECHRRADDLGRRGDLSPLD